MSEEPSNEDTPSTGPSPLAFPSLSFDDPPRPLWGADGPVETDGERDQLPPPLDDLPPLPDTGRGGDPNPPEGSGAPPPPPPHDYPRAGVGSGGPSSYSGPIFQRRRTVKERVPFAYLVPGPRALVVAVLAFGIWWLTENWDRQLSPEPGDRGMVLTAEWLAEFTDRFTFRPEAEVFEKHRTLDGRLRYDYRYSPGGDYQPDLTVTVNLEKTEAKAKDVYEGIELSSTLKWRQVGQGALGFVELDQECHWGQQSRAFLVLVNGKPVGNGFLARNGVRCIQVMLKGIPMEDGWELRDLLDPTLRQLAAYRR